MAQIDLALAIGPVEIVVTRAVVGPLLGIVHKTVDVWSDVDICAWRVVDAWRLTRTGSQVVLTSRPCEVVGDAQADQEVCGVVLDQAPAISIGAVG